MFTDATITGSGVVHLTMETAGYIKPLGQAPGLG